MYKIEELKENILLAASTLGIDIDLKGTNLSSEEKCALKRELIEGFRTDPVIATFITVSLKNGIDFNWLNMYEDKRSLYQINLGIIQGIDMSFSKRAEFTPLQLEAIRQWSKRGVNMKDLSFNVLSHKKIRILAELKQAGCNYVELISKHHSSGYLKHYLDVYKLLGDSGNREVFLMYDNVTNSKRLLKEGIDLRKLETIGFFEADEDLQLTALAQLGIAFRIGNGDKIRWVFDNIELFSIQEISMINDILKLKNLKQMKEDNEKPVVIILKSLGIETIKGNVIIYQSFFEKDHYAYHDNSIINCIKYGIDMTPLFGREINSTVKSCMLNILNNLIVKEYGEIFIPKIVNIFVESLDLIKDCVSVYKKLNCIVSKLRNYGNIDFEILLDQSIPDESKINAIVAKHLKLDVKAVENMHFSYFRFSDLLEQEVHPDLLKILQRGINVESLVSELNDNANLIDISKFNFDNLSGANVKILGKFNHLKHLPGFYELGHKNLFGTPLFLGLDALELGLDIFPVVKYANALYAENVLKNMIEEHLNTTNYIPHSESEYKCGKFDEFLI